MKFWLVANLLNLVWTAYRLWNGTPHSTIYLIDLILVCCLGIMVGFLGYALIVTRALESRK